MSEYPEGLWMNINVNFDDWVHKDKIEVLIERYEKDRNYLAGEFIVDLQKLLK